MEDIYMGDIVVVAIDKRNTYCMVVSDNELNMLIDTVVVVPIKKKLTTTETDYKMFWKHNQRVAMCGEPIVIYKERVIEIVDIASDKQLDGVKTKTRLLLERKIQNDKNRN